MRCGSLRWGGKEVVMVMGTVCVMSTGTDEGEVEAGRVRLGE